MLVDRRRDITVKWLFRKERPFDEPSLPIYRLLVSRLVVQAKEFGLTLCQGAKNASVSPIKRGRYLVEYDWDGLHESVICQQVLFRWGSERYKSEVEPQDRKDITYPKLLRSVASAFESPSPAILEKLNEFLDKGKVKNHERCNLSCGWEEDDDPSFVKDLKSEDDEIPIPRLRAEFITAFDKPDPDLGNDTARIVYRIRIWLLDVHDHLQVRYDLHPEEGNKPISRFAMGPNYEQWLNTRNDYTIRVHTSDGFEWNVGTILNALKERYELAGEIEEEKGADPRAREPMRISKDGSVEEQLPEEAMAVLERQTEERHKRIEAQDRKISRG
jgi:hypothetical protein